MRSPRKILPLGAAIVMLAVAGSAVALSSPSLPTIAPDQLLSSVMKSMHNPPAYVSGEVLSHVDLGLPEIGGFSHSVSPTSVVSGDHSVRIWMSQDGFRIDDLLSLAQRSLFVSKTDAWAYDSERFTAWHIPLPAARAMQRQAPMPTPDPLEMSRRALNAIDPTTAVSVAGTTAVAGRDAYVLRLVPRSAATLVGRIEIAIDAARRLPLRISIFAKGAGRPAISIGFRTIGFAAFGPSVFTFKPPKGANVKSQLFNRGAPGRAGTGAGVQGSSGSYAANHFMQKAPEQQSMRTFGSGWDSIIAFKAPSQQTLRQRGSMNLAQILPYSGPLFSVRLVQVNGSDWIVAGMVRPSALTAVANQLA